MVKGLHAGRAVGNAIAKESGRSHTDDGERVRLDGDCLPDDGGIGAEFALPGAVTDYDDGSRCGLVVGLAQNSANIGSNSESGEIIAGNEFTAQFSRKRVAAPHAPLPLPGLHRGQ